MGSTILKNILPVEKDGGPIHMLNIDTLLVIFNYLSLYDKLMAMRVNKKWHHLIQNHAWTVIDFRDKGPIREVQNSERQYRRFVSKSDPAIFEYRECDNEWQFPTNQVLTFLDRYAGKSLKAIYLTVYLSDEIATLLRVNCPNIKTLGIIHSDRILYLPKLQRLDLITDSEFYGHPSDQILPWLEKCSGLQKVSLRGFTQISVAVMKKLSEMTSLRQLELISCSFLKSQTETAEKILFSTIASLTSISCFSLIGRCPYSRCLPIGHINIDYCFQYIAQWTHLKILTLKSVVYTEEAFETMIPGLLNLETLALTGQSVTSSVVTLIGIHLKKLKSLILTSCTFCYERDRQLRVCSLPRYSCESLQSLSNHPMLINLELHQSYNEKYWVEKVYDLLATLPRIRNVKMSVVDISFYFSQKVYPVIKSAEIEVTEINFPFISSSVAENETKLRRTHDVQIL
ncbi:uncharacterized protein [Amphiura filiformis]|uniref:uncharacterized protein n=1 Tax=Amphiura filiformis TaxID=82378 RepID=UPI003B2152EB